MIEAEILKNRGIKRSLDHANAQDLFWSENAYQFLKDFVMMHSGHSFLAEDVREYAEKRGLPIPPSKRAWGGVFVLAKNKKLIKFNGYSKTTNPLAHGTPASSWIKY